MYDWNKDGKIDVVDHWITHQIINYEKEKRENGTNYRVTKNYEEPESGVSGEEKGLSLGVIILIDVVLLILILLIP